MKEVETFRWTTNEVSVIALFTLLSGLVVGFLLTSTYYRDCAVEQGHAEYNSLTGKWKWKEIKETENDY